MQWTIKLSQSGIFLICLLCSALYSVSTSSNTAQFASVEIMVSILVSFSLRFHV